MQDNSETYTRLVLSFLLNRHLHLYNLKSVISGQHHNYIPPPNPIIKSKQKRTAETDYITYDSCRKNNGWCEAIYYTVSQKPKKIKFCSDPKTIKAQNFKLSAEAHYATITFFGSISAKFRRGACVTRSSRVQAVETASHRNAG